MAFDAFSLLEMLEKSIHLKNLPLENELQNTST